VLPRLAYGPRIATALAILAAGVAIQALALEAVPAVAILLGGAVLLAGNSLLLLKGFDLQPKHVRRDTSWERSTLDRFRRVPQMEREVSRWDAAAIDVTCGRGFFALLFFGILPVGVACFLLYRHEEARTLALLVAVDGAVLVVPHWLTGLRRQWRPTALAERVNGLLLAVDSIRDRMGDRARIQPTFRMVGDEGERVPTDARIFLGIPDAPAGFLGVQFQVAINQVQGTNYPYLYAVIVARESFGLLDHVEEVERIADGLTVESTAEDDAHVIVIRQHTTKTSGYHTGGRAVVRIAKAAWTSAERITGVGASRGRRENREKGAGRG
jgi:hypothetical protein